MPIVAYDPSLAPCLAAAYNRSLAGIAHCYPVSAQRMAAALVAAAQGAEPPPHLSGRAPHPRVPLRGGATWLSLEGDEVTGFVHVAVAPAVAPAGGETGAIRALWYARGHRAVGQALLDTATAYLQAQGVARIDAYRYEHRLLLPRGACLSLLAAGARPRPPGRQRLPSHRWRVGPRSARLCCRGSRSPPVDVDISVEWTPGLGARPGLTVHAMRGPSVWACASAPRRQYAPDPCPGLGLHRLAHGRRGVARRGLGRYLMARALWRRGAPAIATPASVAWSTTIGAATVHEPRLPRRRLDLGLEPRHRRLAWPLGAEDTNTARTPVARSGRVLCRVARSPDARDAPPHHPSSRSDRCSSAVP